MISDDLLHAARMSAEDVRAELAVALFREERLTLAQAAEVAEMDRLTFQHVLAARRIPLHYTAEDWQQDLKVSAELTKS
jgi:predicted HTH domain antitoxin